MKRIRYLLAALALPFAALLTHAAITGQSPVTTLQRASAPLRHGHRAGARRFSGLTFYDVLVPQNRHGC